MTSVGTLGPLFLTNSPRIDTKPTGTSLSLWEGSQERLASHHIPVFEYWGTSGWRLRVTTVLALSPWVPLALSCEPYPLVMILFTFHVPAFVCSSLYQYFNLRQNLWCVPPVQNILEWELAHAELRYEKKPLSVTVSSSLTVLFNTCIICLLRSPLARCHLLIKVKKEFTTYFYTLKNDFSGSFLGLNFRVFILILINFMILFNSPFQVF